MTINAVENNSDTRYDVIVKLIPEGQIGQDGVVKMRLFEKEVDIYTKVIPALMEQQTQDGPKIELPVPKCYYGKHSGGVGVLIMENLKIKGYELADIMKGMDLDETKEALKAFAALHAVGYNLKSKLGGEFRKQFSYLYINVFESIKDFIESNLETTLNILNAIPGQESNADKVATANGKLVKLYGDAHKTELETGTICHGDPWLSNVMFRYETDENGKKKVIDAKLVDLQLVSYGMGTCDLGEIIGSSAQADIQKNHLNEVLGAYQDTLMRLLGQMNTSCNIDFDTLLGNFKTTFF